MKATDMKNKSADELKGMIADMRKEQFNLRFQAATGEAVSATRWREIRKDIARAMTVINLKKKKG